MSDAPEKKQNWVQQVATNAKRNAVKAMAVAQMAVPPSASSLAAYTTIGAGALTSCSTEDGPGDEGAQPTQPGVPITTGVTQGALAVYYGEALDQGIRTELSKFDEAVIQPAFYTPSVLFRSARAYASLTGLHQNTHSPELAALRQDMLTIANGQDGYLHQADGSPLVDPLGPGSYMLDLRNPDVADRLKTYIVGLARQHPKGIFLDAIDSATAIENSNPTLYAGLTDAAITLMKDIGQEVEAMSVTYAPKTMVVNGGLFERTTPGMDVAEAIGAYSGHIAEEAQCFSAPGQVRSADDNAWTKARIKVIAEAAKTAGRGGLTIMGIDPTEGNHEAAACESTQFYDRLTQELAAETGIPVSASVFVGGVGYSSMPDILGNAALRTQQVCR